jgi:hypothetical protein
MPDRGADDVRHSDIVRGAASRKSSKVTSSPPELAKDKCDENNEN